MQLPFVSRERYQDAQVEIAQLKARLTETEAARDKALEMSVSLAKAMESSGKTEPAPEPESSIPANPRIRDIKRLASADAQRRYQENRTH